jgi:hypothetical protein
MFLMQRIAEIHSDTNGYAYTVSTVKIYGPAFINSYLMPIVYEMENTVRLTLQRLIDYYLRYVCHD